jgi:DNA-binding GntR family transcriptional regulator
MAERSGRNAELQSTLRIDDVPTVRSMVAQKLREAIMSGTLKPGQRLIEHGPAPRSGRLHHQS